MAQYVSQCRSLFAPIRRLPRDVLGSIFAYVARSARNSFDIGSAPWFLAHICYIWRDVVFTTPLLWANIVVCLPHTRGEVTMLGKHLQFTGECPLDISFSFRDFVPFNDIETFSLILQHSTHWKRMQITFLYDVYTIMQKLSTVAGKLPLLEEIVFLCTRRIGLEIMDTELLVTASSFGEPGFLHSSVFIEYL